MVYHLCRSGTIEAGSLVVQQMLQTQPCLRIVENWFVFATDVAVLHDFLVFFFVEIMNRILIHPIQYTLVGISLVVFYVLLLAFSEQIDFGWAYFVSATMTISLVCLYAKNLLKSWSLVGILGTILTLLYVFIFVIIQLQDYALLFGSIGIFLILAITMFFSRKIDWFQADQVEATVIEKVE